MIVSVILVVCLIVALVFEMRSLIIIPFAVAKLMVLLEIVVFLVFVVVLLLILKSFVTLVIFYSSVVMHFSLVRFVFPPLLVSKFKSTRAATRIVLWRVPFILGVKLFHLFSTILNLWLHLEAALITILISIVVSCLVFFLMLILFLFRFKRVLRFLWSVFTALSFIVVDFLLSLFLLAFLLLSFLFFLLFKHLLLLRRLDLVDRSDEGSNLSLRL
jgi:hypothetical protein